MRSSLTSASATPRPFPIRRMDFSPALGTVPKHFARDGDILMSHLFALLSATFPAGEEFFVQSVRHYRDQITDPVLKAQVSSFIGQESVHARQHRALNDRLRELGYPVDQVDRFNTWALRLRTRFQSPEGRLAQTAASEHQTATLAELLLCHPEAREYLGDGVVRGIVLWHALEEAEHKAVAFDVYQAIGGSERHRRRAIRAVRIASGLQPWIVLILALCTDPAIRRPGALRGSWRTLRSSPFLDRGVRERLREYERPDFHPNDNDATAALDEWQERLFGAAGSLTDVLVEARSA